MNVKQTSCGTCGGRVGGLVLVGVLGIMGMLAMIGKGQTERRQDTTAKPDVLATSPDKGSSTKEGGNTLQFTDENFNEEVLRAETPVLVDFWAEWCPSCRVLGPTVDELAREYAGKVRVGKVDIDANKELPVRYGISGLPTVLVFVNGEVHRRFLGPHSKKEYESVLDKLVG